MKTVDIRLVFLSQMEKSTQITLEKMANSDQKSQDNISSQMQTIPMMISSTFMEMEMQFQKHLET